MLRAVVQMRRKRVRMKFAETSKGGGVKQFTMGEVSPSTHTREQIPVCLFIAKRSLLSRQYPVSWSDPNDDPNDKWSTVLPRAV